MKARLVKLRENWRRLLDIVKQVPPSHFDMGVYGRPHRTAKKHECGTIGCLIGHAGLDPYFQKQGIETYVTESGGSVDGDWQEVFGCTEFFYPDRGHSTKAEVTRNVERLLDVLALAEDDEDVEVLGEMVLRHARRRYGHY